MMCGFCSWLMGCFGLFVCACMHAGGASLSALMSVTQDREGYALAAGATKMSCAERNDASLGCMRA